MKLRLWERSRTKALAPNDPWDLSSPVLHWGSEPWTVRESVEGLLVLGRTGSGKTSGPGRLVATSMLRAGYGGLVLCAKADEAALWRGYCRDTNRLADLIELCPEGPWRFNPLAYELSRPGVRHTENMVRLFTTLLELAERDGGQGTKADSEPYWRLSVRQLIRNFVGLLIQARGTVTFSDLYRAIMSAPQSVEEVASKAWQDSSLCFRLLREAEQRLKTESDSREFELIADYVLGELPKLASRTRSIIVSTFTSQIDVMQRGLLFDLFGRDTTITPEATEQGKILVVNVSVKEHGEIGTIANVLMKYALQRSIERRDIRKSPRPVFLFADECQHFLTSYDQMHQTTCRSAKVATVMLSQNISNFYAALGGGDKGRVETDSLVANLSTRIFCANGDAVTNEWAATQIGRTRKLFMNSSSSAPTDDWFQTVTGVGGGGQSNAGMNEQMAFEVEPSVFTTLRTGGPTNGGLIDAILYQSGRRFSDSGRTWIPVTFSQAPRSPG